MLICSVNPILSNSLVPPFLGGSESWVIKITAEAQSTQGKREREKERKREREKERKRKREIVI
jgi:hypothetical protein